MATVSKILILLVLMCSGEFSDAEEFRQNDASRLMKVLVRSSNASVLPVINTGRKPKPVVVKIGVMLYQIINVDNKNQIITLSLFMRQKWHNDLLHWNSSDYGGLKSINIQKDKLWVPDIYIYNHAEGGVKSGLDQWKTPITIFADGLCTWLSPGVVKTSCKLNVRYFPFDEQYCKIKFGSWTYNGFQVDVEPDHTGGQADTSKFVKSGEWDLAGFPVIRNEEVYACCPEPYPDVTFTLIIKRRTRYYYINMLLPNMFITVLTMVAFFLPPDCGERISLIITNFLSMVVFLLLVAEILPPNSEVTPMISIYCAGLMCEVGLALLASCVVLRLYCRHSGFDKMPKWVKVGVLQWLAKLTFTTTLVQKVDEDTDEKAKKFLEFERRENEARFGRNMHGLVESMCLLSPEWDSTYDIDVVEEMQLDNEISGEPWSTHKFQTLDPNEKVSQQLLTQHTSSSAPQTMVQGTKDCICTSLVDKLESHQKTLLDHVANMSSMLVDQEIAQEKRKEWQLASAILDRSFLVFFIVGLVVSSVAIFMQVPNT